RGGAVEIRGGAEVRDAAPFAAFLRVRARSRAHHQDSRDRLDLVGARAAREALRRRPEWVVRVSRRPAAGSVYGLAAGSAHRPRVSVGERRLPGGAATANP